MKRKPIVNIQREDMLSRGRRSLPSRVDVVSQWVSGSATGSHDRPRSSRSRGGSDA
jgi:hypothetical protein